MSIPYIPSHTTQTAFAQHITARIFEHIKWCTRCRLPGLVDEYFDEDGDLSESTGYDCLMRCEWCEQLYCEDCLDVHALACHVLFKKKNPAATRAHKKKCGCGSCAEFNGCYYPDE